MAVKSIRVLRGRTDAQSAGTAKGGNTCVDSYAVAVRRYFYFSLWSRPPHLLPPQRSRTARRRQLSARLSRAGPSTIHTRATLHALPQGKQTPKAKTGGASNQLNLM